MTTIDPETVERIARGLTKAEVAAFHRSRNENMHRDWVDHISTYGDTDCAQGLYNKGLIEKPKTLARATPLGLAVREYLERNHD